MRSWQVTFDAQTWTRKHAFTKPHSHALGLPAALAVYRNLDITGSLYSERNWWPLRVAPNLILFELQYGVEVEREAQNNRCFAEVAQTKTTLRAEYAGYKNLFVPVVRDGEFLGLLTTGPFATKRPTSESILAAWHSITGRQGHLADPGFSSYVSMSLSTLVLDQGRDVTFQRMLEQVAALIAGAGDAEEHVNEAERLLVELWPIRMVERTWSAVEIMLDERSGRELYSRWRAAELNAAGLSRAPDQVLAGLLVRSKADLDPVEEAVRRDAFRRAAVDLSRKVGEVAVGKVGDHGIVFLGAGSGTAQQRKNALRELAERAALLARQEFDLAVHFGAALASGNLSLIRTYQAALGAAESALTEGTRLVLSEPGVETRLPPLWQLHKQLASIADERPAQLLARFDRYLETVAMHTGYSFEPTRAYLEIGFQRIAEGLVASGALDQKSLVAMYTSLARAATEARTVRDLLSAYRRVVVDLSEAQLSPAPARQERHLQGALDYIRDHYTEALSFRQVAKVAGFNPTYFSELFRKREGMTFEKYVLNLRIERAKQLLARTKTPVTRVATLVGFNSPQYFSSAFHRALGMSPLEYRLRHFDSPSRLAKRKNRRRAENASDSPAPARRRARRLAQA
jgi:AraC-like DNA-binding protein